MIYFRQIDLMKSRNLLRVRRRSFDININVVKLAAWSTESGDPPDGVRELGDSVWLGGDLPAKACGLKVVGTPIGTLSILHIMVSR